MRTAAALCALGAALWAGYRAVHRFAPSPINRTIESPNADDRPFGTSVDCIVLHATAMPDLERVLFLFQNPASRLSSHYVIGKDGTIVQVVDPDRRAWHAGISEFVGVPRVNDFSVGIELVNLNDGVDRYPDAQVDGTANLLRYLRFRYGIPADRIVSHALIARPPGRKSDPIGLDIPRLIMLSE